jgi:glycosyltransferase involved in cell wall biosynthesis
LKSLRLLKKYSHFINKYFSNSFIKSIFVIRYGKKYFKIIKDEQYKIFVLTNFHKKFLINNNIRTKNIKIVPNYLKDTIYEVENEETPKKEEYFIYAGRISEEKGLIELINSFLSCNFTKTKLKIIGDGPLLKNLKKDYELDTVEFLGEQKNEYVLNAISKSKGVVTATKLFEGQPTLLCEASLMGIPSIFPKTGGISEFFPQNYQFSFTQYDYSDLKKKFLELNSMKNSYKIGKKNKEFINDYLKEDTIIKFFDEAINSNE